MNKIIVFDAGPVISLTLNNLLWILEPLNKKFNGKFYVPMAVKKELIDKPLNTRKFKFEALQIIPLITNNTIELIENDFIVSKTRFLVDLANRCFKAKGNFIQIIQEGEMETVATALYFNCQTIVVDERITRMLIEDPNGIKHLLERRLHTAISVDKINLKKFNEVVKGLNVIRSIELVTIAYELGILDKYMDKNQRLMVKDVEKVLLEGVLWAVKLNGCSVNEDEINDIINFEIKKNN
jgi:hypothetical protein